MPSIDEIKTQEMQEAGSDVPVNDDDIELAVRTGIKLMQEGGGVQVIKDALDTSQDPGLVVGQFMAQLIGMLGEQLGSEFDIDPRTFLAKGGFLEHMLDYIEGELGLPKEFSDQVYAECIEVIKGAAADPPPPNDVMGPQQGPGIQGAPPQGGPPPNQGGMM